MTTLSEDKQLVEGILKGDERYLYQYYQFFSVKLLKFIKRKTRNLEDAEEILQDTLLSSLDSLRNFTFKSSLSTFLHAICKNKIIDYYRKKSLKKIFFSQVPQIESFLATLLGPEEIFERKLARLNFEKALKSLKPNYRKIIALKYFEGKSVVEITKDLKISFKSAESLLFRARQAFASALIK